MYILEYQLITKLCENNFGFLPINNKMGTTNLTGKSSNLNIGTHFNSSKFKIY